MTAALDRWEGGREPPDQRVYHGIALRPTGGIVLVGALGLPSRRLPRRHDLRWHAAGVDWGHDGDAVRQCALDVLSDAIGDAAAIPLYPLFVEQVVAHLRLDGDWWIAAATIIAWAGTRSIASPIREA